MTYEEKEVVVKAIHNYFRESKMNLMDSLSCVVGVLLYEVLNRKLTQGDDTLLIAGVADALPRLFAEAKALKERK